MKIRSAFVTLLVITIGVFLNAGEKGKYGQDLTLKKKTKISEILADPASFDGKKVQVAGAIVAVCEKRGCWIKISGDKEFESIRFKVEDGVIVFPMEIKGQNVVAEGIVSVSTMTKEQLIEQGKKHAKETGEEFDPATVTGSKTTVMIKGEGAVVSK